MQSYHCFQGMIQFNQASMLSHLNYFYPITSAFHTSTFFDIEKDKENSLRRGRLQLDWAESNIGRTSRARSRAFF